MGTAKSGDSELIRVTLIDYFSSAILVDHLVYPDVEMQHYNTRFSGVTRREMEVVRRKGQCLMGKDRARKAVWQFVGPNTVVVGHSAHNDLTALRWIHPVVVDTFLIESTKAKDTKAKTAQEKKEADSPTVVSIDVAGKPNKDQQPRHRRVKGSGPLSLKSLAKVRLGREIQIGGKKGHDSLEDAIAARDLAHWNVVNKDSEASQY